MASMAPRLLLVSTILAMLIPVAAVAEDSTSPSINGTLGITQGAHIRPTIFWGPPVWGYGDEILAFDSLVGKDIGVVMYFSDWRHVPGDHALDTFLLGWIQSEIIDPSRRPAIMLTWEPTRPGTVDGGGSFGCTKSYVSEPIPPQDIIDGVCDDYLVQFAEDVKARPERFLLRFAHEMNITDSPWWPGNWETRDANLYVQMYRHVHDVIMAEPDPPTNVEWVWSPNYASNPTDAWNAINNYYPGDDYVDWIGLSGYNWYDAPNHSEPWRDFNYLYDSVLTDFSCRYAKPQIIAEVGSVEGTGGMTKAGWISDLYQRAPNYPFLRSVVWFNDYAAANSSLADFRVTTGSADESSPDSVDPLPSSTHAWTNAYSSGVAASIYTSTLPSLASATPANVICDQVYLPLISR